MPNNPANLLPLAIGMLGDYSYFVNDVPFHSRLENIDSDLRFSAQYFDAYYQSKLNTNIDPYLILIGAASYYLCDLPGSSHVLTGYLGTKCPELDADGLEHFMFWLLQGKRGPFEPKSKLFGPILRRLSVFLSYFIRTGKGAGALSKLTNQLRAIAYNNGSARHLLFSDIIGAIIRVMYEHSCWRCLPELSNLEAKAWVQTIQKDTFLKELWPAQRLLGKQGVFAGKSAIIQMPTSAGKTRATEIIIRSAFISKRTSLAIIVAPFRALCHEIKNALANSFFGEDVSVEEFTDVLQNDSEIIEGNIQQQILVVTPEKLVYVLKHSPEFANDIGLLIYDEGHQFDSGSRGVTFELLLTSLKNIVSKAQTVLISAVLSNAEAINDWLNPNGAEVVSGLELVLNHKSIAFSSWNKNPGQLKFVNEKNPSLDSFYVPRIIQSYNIGRKKGAKSDRYFPERNTPKKNNSNSVAIFLGMKLAAKGAVAIFCGTKNTAIALGKLVVDISQYTVPIQYPAFYSDPLEIERLAYLHSQNLGNNSISTVAARLGVFSHHNNVPQGIRQAVEYSIRAGLTKFVLCTSTLSQGVNLPIRYLIVNGLQQGPEAIKIRDFHNLIGRAGRAGMRTEGSIIFSNHDIYDGKGKWGSNWRWEQAIALLKPESSEPCTSYLLSIFDGFQSDDKKWVTPNFNIIEFVERYINGSPFDITIADITSASVINGKFSANNLREQVINKINILASIESYLMSYAVEPEIFEETDVTELTRNTLAYYLAEEEERKNLVALFKSLEENINKVVPSYSRRRAFGKTLFGLRKSLEIERWVSDNLLALPEASISVNELLIILWPVIEGGINSKAFYNLTNKRPLLDFAILWINCESFYDLLIFLESEKVQYKWGNSTRKLTVEQVVDLCQNALAYEGTLVISAVCSILELLSSNKHFLLKPLRILQKMLQYGLPSSSAIVAYEAGFTDRLISMKLSSIGIDIANRNDLIKNIRVQHQSYSEIIHPYPAYFEFVLNDLAK